MEKGVSVVQWDYEDGICFKLDKEYFGWDEHVFLVFVYMRPNTSTRNDLHDGANCYDLLLDQLSKVSDQGGVVIAGDMNARTGEREDCMVINNKNGELQQLDRQQILNQIDLNENALCENDFVLNGMSVKRVNCDKKVNDYGVKLIQLCYACDLVIMNGRAGVDRSKGSTTFCNHNGESTIDYVICDKCVMYKMKNVKVHDINELSDHSIVSFELIINTVINYCSENVPNYGKCYTRWNDF